MFPAGCIRFNGPHTLACKRSMWENAGCSRYAYDDEFFGEEVDSLNLVLVYYMISL